MRLILIRHAESNANVKKVLGGYRSRLSKNGIIQARKLGMRLKNEKIDVIFSSKYSRAAQTARFISKFQPKTTKLVFLNEIKERNYGKLDGKHEKHFGAARELSGKPRHSFRPEGGENYSDVKKRVKKFYCMLRKKYNEKTVVVVSHAVFIKIFIVCILKKPPSKAADMQLNQNNACINVIDVDKKAKLITINDTRHLN